MVTYFCYQFENANHLLIIQLIDQETGLIEEIQLKSTDIILVRSWIEQHGDNIVVTDEVAEHLGLESVGLAIKNCK